MRDYSYRATVRDGAIESHFSVPADDWADAYYNAFDKWWADGGAESLNRYRADHVTIEIKEV